MKGVAGAVTSLVAACILAACSTPPDSPATPSPSPSASSSAWPESQCRDLAATVGAALQGVVDSYEQATGPQSTATPTASESATPAPAVDGDSTRIQDALEEVGDAVEDLKCAAQQMRQDVDEGIDEVRAETPLAEAVRARLVAGLEGRIPELPVRRAIFPDDDLHEALAEAPSGSALLLSEGEWDLTGPLVLLSAVTLEGKGAGVTRLSSSAPEAAVLVATAEPVALQSLTLARDTDVPGSGIVAGGAATLVLSALEVTGGRPDDTGGGAGVMLVGEELAAERRTSLEATDVVLRDNGWAGLAVAGTHRVSVTEATFSGNGECGLCFLGESDGSVSGSAFDGNKVGVAVAESSRPTLLDLTIDGGEVGLQVEGSAAPIVDGATISGSSRAAVIVGGKATGALASVVCRDVDFGIVVTDTAAPTLTDNECALARGSIGSGSPSPSPGEG
ncbi:MAG TPA: right-handed parallel beta-helix repeat-containing protein [Arachnia sp.]|nr:right-handed parallel beta-helix repeat-containing protein [Arachnia sp.]